MGELTHFNDQGRAKMVDVTEKNQTKRVAVACGSIKMLPKTFELIKAGKIGKGDVLAVAQVAGIMGAKKTSELIPMCHPIPITGVDITFSEEGNDTITIQSSVKTTGVTGVEMEALTAVSITMLTIYDMCKAVDKEMTLGETYLVSKSGGKSGDFKRGMRV